MNIRLPLADIYATIFGASPGSQVGGVCNRLDLYFANGPIGAGAIMIVIMLGVLDMFIAASSGAERALRDAELAFDMRTSEAISNEQHVIARMANTLAAMQQDNVRLHAALGRRNRRARRSVTKAVTVALLGAVCFLLGRYTI